MVSTIWTESLYLKQCI